MSTCDSTDLAHNTALGPAVNLASRLCSLTRDGEILLDARTAELTGMTGLEARVVSRRGSSPSG